MSSARRRLIRSPTLDSIAAPVDQRKVQKLRERLAHEREALARWQMKLRRAFNAFEKAQKRIVRLEKQIASLLDGGG